MAGMSSYFVFTINSETYLVSPGALANSSAGFAQSFRSFAAQRQSSQCEGCLAEITSNHGRSPVGQASACVSFPCTSATAEACPANLQRMRRSPALRCRRVSGYVSWPSFRTVGRVRAAVPVEIHKPGEIDTLLCRRRMRGRSLTSADSIMASEDNVTQKFLWRGFLIVALCMVLAIRTLRQSTKFTRQ